MAWSVLPVGAICSAKYTYFERVMTLPTVPFVTMSSIPDQAQNTPAWFTGLVNRAERRGGPQRQGTLNEWFRQPNVTGVERRVLARSENQQNAGQSNDVSMSPPAPVLPLGATTSQVCTLYFMRSSSNQGYRTIQKKETYPTGTQTILLRQT